MKPLLINTLKERRLNMAAGLIHHPKVILMDEPTVGVDPQSRNHIFESVHNHDAIFADDEAGIAARFTGIRADSGINAVPDFLDGKVWVVLRSCKRGQQE